MAEHGSREVIVRRRQSNSFLPFAFFLISTGTGTRPGFAAAGTVATVATAANAVVADLEAPPEAREEAAAVSLAYRSMLGAQERVPVTSRELRFALDALLKTAPGVVPSISPSMAPPLMQKLSSDRFFLGAFTASAGRWEVRGEVLGADGKQLARVVADAAPGETSTLARHVARRIAARMGLAVVEAPDLPLGALRPFARAALALGIGDSTLAAQHLEIANRDVAQKLPAAREVARAVWQNPSIDATARIGIALLAGDTAGASTLADKVLEADPANVPARAGKIRALAAIKDFPAAHNEIKKLPPPGPVAKMSPFAAIAVAELAMQQLAAQQRGIAEKTGVAAGTGTAEDLQDRRDTALFLAIKDPGDDARPVLAFMSGAGPNTFGADLENAAVPAASRLAAKNPALASAIAVRAIKGGVQIPGALPMVQAKDLNMAELAALKRQLTASGTAGRPEAMAIAGELDGRTRMARALRTATLGVPPSVPEALPLVIGLRGLVARFDALAAGDYSRVIVLGSSESGQFPLWPLVVRPYRLQDGLVLTLTDEPYDLTLAGGSTGENAIDESQEGRAAAMADELGADAVLIHRVRPAWLAADVQLTLIDAATRKSVSVAGLLDGGGTGLLALNPVPLALPVVAPIGLVIFVLLRRRKGSVEVRLQGDFDAEDRFLSVVISRSAKAPAITDMAAHIEQLKKLGSKREALCASMIDRQTQFSKIPVGRWYVHVYGTFKRGKTQRVATGDLFTQEIQVARKKTVVASFSLDPVNAEFHVTVFDEKQAIAGAKVWVDGDSAQSRTTGRNGLAIIEVPRGKHVIHVHAKGLHIERPFEVVKIKAHELPINLVWERRVDDVSRALEQSAEEKAVEGEPIAEVEAVAGAVAEDPATVSLMDAGVSLAEADLPVAEAEAETIAEAQAEIEESPS